MNTLALVLTIAVVVSSTLLIRESDVRGAGRAAPSTTSPRWPS